MVERFDRVLLAAPDLAEAVAQYTTLLGVDPVMADDSDGDVVAWWILPNTVIEVRQGSETPSIAGLAFAAEGAGAVDSARDNALGLHVSLCDGSRTAGQRIPGGPGQCEDFSVDHVVLRTSSADNCVALFRDELGMRLALDKTVPQWGGRMLFFRTGKLTLEVIEAQGEKPREEDAQDTTDFFWGIAYQCPDIDAAAAGMASRGVTLSEIREGRKPGTRVATVKSHCLDIPTLLIEPAG
ncbi:MAG: VOC family protein [Halioglobus sp.]